MIDRLGSIPLETATILTEFAGSVRRASFCLQLLLILEGSLCLLIIFDLFAVTLGGSRRGWLIHVRHCAGTDRRQHVCAEKRALAENSTNGGV